MSDRSLAHRHQFAPVRASACMRSNQGQGRRVGTFSSASTAIGGRRSSLNRRRSRDPMACEEHSGHDHPPRPRGPASTDGTGEQPVGRQVNEVKRCGRAQVALAPDDVARLGRTNAGLNRAIGPGAGTGSDSRQRSAKCPGPGLGTLGSGSRRPTESRLGGKPRDGSDEDARCPQRPT